MAVGSVGSLECILAELSRLRPTLISTLFLSWAVPPETEKRKPKKTVIFLCAQTTWRVLSTGLPAMQGSQAAVLRSFQTPLRALPAVSSSSAPCSAWPRCVIEAKPGVLRYATRAVRTQLDAICKTRLIRRAVLSCLSSATSSTASSPRILRPRAPSPVSQRRRPRSASRPLSTPRRARLSSTGERDDHQVILSGRALLWPGLPN